MVSLDETLQKFVPMLALALCATVAVWGCLGTSRSVVRGPGEPLAT